MLKVAIVHYHLEPGGVTRVIENTVKALRSYDVETLILSGKPYKGDLDLNVCVIPELYYTSKNDQPKASALAEKMLTSSKEYFKQFPDAFHVHNHSLGKNAAFADAIYLIAEKKIPLLYQIHDLSEDKRPDNYNFLRETISAPKVLYPSAEHIHYALINTRDLRLFGRAGIPTKNLHYLPNPIVFPSLPKGTSLPKLPSKHFIFYPTRGIRRKNLGELVLLSAIDDRDSYFATSLSPKTQSALNIYNYWVRFAKELSLPIHFGFVEDSNLNFFKIIEASYALITTSVQEGFGLAFLETWAFEKPLCGRDLPEITEDFESQGIDLSSLYKRVNIPLELIDMPSFEACLKKALHSYFNSYSQKAPKDAKDRALASMINNNYIDFGRLNEPFQESVIRKALGSREIQKTLQGLNSLQVSSGQTIKKNRDVVENLFSLEPFGKRLIKMYKEVCSSPGSSLSYTEPENVLTQYLCPDNFMFIRS